MFIFPIETDAIKVISKNRWKHKKTLEYLQNYRRITGDRRDTTDKTELIEIKGKTNAVILNLYNYIHVSAETGVNRVRE